MTATNHRHASPPPQGGRVNAMTDVEANSMKPGMPFPFRAWSEKMG